MTDNDDNLLARLNALKPSSVNFGNGPDAPALDVEVRQPATVEDKLADRLKSLRSGACQTSSPRSSGKSTSESLITSTKDEVATESDPIRNWQAQGNDEEPDLDQLLAELGPDDQWKLDPDDSNNINSLLKEASDALPKNDKPDAEEGRGEAQKPSKFEVDAGFDDREDGEDHHKRSGDEKDNEEADDYVQRVLAELEFDKAHGINDEPDSDADQNTSTLDLPSTPSTLPRPSTTTNQEEDPRSYEDSELSSRFSNLRLTLPSTPSGPPSARIKSTINSKLAQAKKAPDLQVYKDEDIDSWCCICNDDSTLRCLGCDGDL